MRLLYSRLPPSVPLLPAAFIVLWSTGYIASKMGLGETTPYVLLVARFTLATACLALIAMVMRARWPRQPRDYLHLAISGMLMQTLQFAGLYVGIKSGVSAGIAALIVGMMPIATAIGAGVVLGEQVGTRQWLGLSAGVAGVFVVVSSKFGHGLNSAPLWGYACVGLALLGVTSGTLYQKRFCQHMDLRTGGCVQQGAAAITSALLYLWLDMPGTWTDVVWSERLIFAVLWLALVNSIGGFSLLYVLVRRGDASKVASLFYLIPPVTALMGFVVLGETLTPTVLLGFMLTASAVYFCTHTPKPLAQSAT